MHQALHVLQQPPPIYSTNTHNEHIHIPKVTQKTWPTLQNSINLTTIESRHSQHLLKQVQFAKGTLFLSDPNQIIPIPCGTETAPRIELPMLRGTKTARTKDWNL
jgi:hypothetical protein